MQPDRQELTQTVKILFNHRSGDSQLLRHRVEGDISTTAQTHHTQNRDIQTKSSVTIQCNRSGFGIVGFHPHGQYAAVADSTFEYWPGIENIHPAHRLIVRVIFSQSHFYKS